MSDRRRQVMNDKNQLDFQQVVSVLLSRRRLVYLAVALSLIAAALLLLVVPRYYEATVLLAVDSESSNPLELLSLTEQVPIERDISLLSSRTIAEEVVRRLHLDHIVTADDAAAAANLTQLALGDAFIDTEVTVTLGATQYEVSVEDLGRIGVGAYGRPFTAEGVSLQIDLPAGAVGAGAIVIERQNFNEFLEKFRERVAVSEVSPGSGVVKISYRGVDQARVAEVANLIAKIYLETKTSIIGSEAEQSMVFLEGQLNTIRASLNTAERDLNAFKQETRLYDVNVAATGLISRVAEYEVRLAELDIQRRRWQDFVDQMRKGSPSEFLVSDLAAGNPALVTLTNAYVGAQTQLNAQLGTLQETNPVVVQARLEVKNLRQQILTAADNALKGIAAAKAAVEAEKQGAEGNLQRLPHSAQAYAELQRNATVNAELYVYLLKAYEEARVRRAAIVSGVYVIDKAVAPDKPVSPKVPLVLALAVLFGLALGAGGALLVNFVVDPLGSPEQIEAQLGVPVIAVIPLWNEASAIKDRPLAEVIEDSNIFSEAVRNLRTQIALQRKAADRPWRITIASPMSNEGKSTVVSYLALLFGALGQKTLVVDADLRHPGADRHPFALRGGPGFADYLSTPQLTLAAIAHEAAPNVAYVTPGRGTPLASELISGFDSTRLEAEAAAAGYTLIIYDTPAATLFTDAVLLGLRSDAVYLILSHGHSSRRPSAELVQGMRAAGVPLKGLIVNRFKDLALTAYGYGYGYGKGYGADSRYGAGGGGRYRTVSNTQAPPAPPSAAQRLVCWARERIDAMVTWGLRDD